MRKAFSIRPSAAYVPARLLCETSTLFSTPTTRSDTQKLVRELSRSCSLGSELSLSGRKPGRFRAAARRVIAEKRLSTVDSDPSGSRKED